MTAFFGIFTGTVIMISHHKYMNKRTQQQYYCVGKDAFYKIHDLRIPEWPLRNYEEARGKVIIKIAPFPISLFTSISPLWELIMALAIANPNPDPNVFSLVDPR